MFSKFLSNFNSTHPLCVNVNNDIWYYNNKHAKTNRLICNQTVTTAKHGTTTSIRIRNMTHLAIIKMSICGPTKLARDGVSAN